MTAMTEEIQPEVLKRTQESLGKFIKKPVLSEKLLRKPPFRFLHDICTSAMKETGFLEDTLSGNDVKVELITDKEGKIAFLQKVIAAVESANNVKLSVKPQKIVAGHEPAKTNEFLQALANALEKQVETVAPKKPVKKIKAKAETKEDATVKRKNTVNKAQKPPSTTADTQKRDPKTRKPDKKPDRGSEEVKKKSKEKDDGKVRVKKKTDKPDEVINVPEETISNGHLENGVPEQADEIIADVKENEAVVMNGVDNIQETEKELAIEEPEVKTQEPINRPVSAKFKKRTPSAHKVASEPVSSEPTLPTPEITPVSEEVDRVLGGVVNDSDVSPDAAATPSPASTTIAGPLKATVPIKNASAVPIDDSAATFDSSPAPRPRTAIRPPSARPASARPAAPRIRDRGQVPVQEDIVKPAAGKVILISEQETAQEDDEELVSVQTGQDTLAAAEEQPSGTFPAATDGLEHGHLVSQILEAQKELEDDIFAKKGTASRTDIEWSSTRGLEGTRKEVERTRSAVQALTRAANPLGKLLEYLQDDVDSMQQELHSWRERNASLSVKLNQERSLTDKSIEPLKTHLQELELTIKQEIEQIAALKAAIFRNDQKITLTFTGL